MKKFIRNAELSDWLRVLDIMQKLHDAAPYSSVPINENDMKRMFYVACRSTKHLSIVVADKKHNIYGICVGALQLNWWGAKAAIELITYANVPGWQDKLINRYKKWAFENDANFATIVNSAGVNQRYDQLISKTGFKQIGSIHFMLPEDR